MRNNKKALLDAFCKRLGYSFSRPELLREALTHRSLGVSHNERLEFLGDSVLNCAVAGIVFKRFPEMPEGRLSRFRASLVNQQALSDLALQLDMDKLIRLGEGEIKSGGNRRPSILADAFEAVLGAVYLDSDFLKAEEVVEKLYAPLIEKMDTSTQGKDPKTLLQEFLQGQKLALPEYQVVKTLGMAHQQQFRVECVIPELKIQTCGEGASRRSAEQAAAKLAYDQVCDLH